MYLSLGTPFQNITHSENPSRSPHLRLGHYQESVKVKESSFKLRFLRNGLLGCLDALASVVMPLEQSFNVVSTAGCAA